MPHIGVIAIGRNEGERLRRCLASVVGRHMTVIYVDSGSTDGSVELARSLGAHPVELDMSLPFSAARARNAGVDALLGQDPGIDFVQFVDGDCELRDGWMDRAQSELEADAKAAVVCGRRRERFPQRSIYNRLADLEWDVPAGQVKSCGGDAMMRLSAFQQAGGFDPSIVAGEEPELCRRLRKAGWTILRIDAEMTWHDAAITRFPQWWNRQVRSGYGASDVATRFADPSDPLFDHHIRSARVWTIGWASVLFVAAFAGLLIDTNYRPRGAAIGVGLLLVVWLLQVMKLAARNFRRTRDLKLAMAFGMLTMIGKWGFWLGRRRYLRDRQSGRLSRLIDYKAAGAPAAIGS